MFKKILFVSAVVFMLAFSVSPVLASFDSNMVWNDNMAVVDNDVLSEANTGDNFAAGSYAGNGGSGGDIGDSRDGFPMPHVIGSEGVEADCDGEDGIDVEGSTTGSGGDGGDAGIGGTVFTGDAAATSEVNNRLNYNETDIEACPCDDLMDCECDEGDQVASVDVMPMMFMWGDANMVNNRNEGVLANRVVARANTGGNDADGSVAGTGGNGGDIEPGDGGEVDDSTTGNGGMGGSSSDGGFVQTGRSDSISRAVNVVNTNITRIYRTATQAIED